MWEDVAALQQLLGRPWDGTVIAVNDIGVHWPHSIDHWVSLHPNKFARWKRERVECGLSLEGITTWGRIWELKDKPADKELKPVMPCGSSGLFAVEVAREVGCQKVVLCGIPITTTPHFAETTENFAANWMQANGHWKAWLRYQDGLRGWVKSMSGRTRDLLGAPTKEWLDAVLYCKL